MNIQSNFEKKV